MPKPIQKPKKKLPFLTDEDLAAPCKAVKIRIFGEYFKRGDHRNEVYEEEYEATIVVPAAFMPGHVKLMANRYVKDIRNKLNGIRARTFYVDTEVAPEPVTDKEYRVRDFMSEMSLDDNRRARERYEEQQQAERAQREAMEDPNYVETIPTGVSVRSRWVEDDRYSVDVGGDD